MEFPSRKQVERIKETYPGGTRVRLTKWNDTVTELPIGLKGTVDKVDDIGTVHVIWDNGFRLGVIIGEDGIEKC